MAITTLQVGQPHLNLQLLEKSRLTAYSRKEKVLTPEVTELLRNNYHLKPSSFERLRAKTIAVLVGGALPIAISALFGFVFYGLYQTGALATAFQRIQAAVSQLAAKAFASITASSATVAASTGGAFIATYALTREPVYNAIGAFFGSLLGSFSGTSLANFVRETQKSGYNWWYSKYHFVEREQTIQNNNNTIVKELTDTYNDMAESILSELGQQAPTVQSVAQLKTRATALKQRLPVIQEILEKQEIPKNKCEEITFQLEKAIGKVLDQQ